MYRCFTCGQHTNTMHEFFYNGKANRNTCINYKLQIPVCPEHHAWYHRHKKIGQRVICNKLELPYEQINIVMNKPVKKWKEYSIKFMSRMREHMEKILERYEV